MVKEVHLKLPKFQLHLHRLRVRLDLHGGAGALSIGTSDRAHVREWAQRVAVELACGTVLRQADLTSVV